ncbi:hypothetical protein QRX50_02470 [Amycolatopsis carbonis]|uniref:DUF3800 domain-containing protein n=1 Tax=Amycolatopsis carbonis TaxID=715471 RepID=A0A9Y2MY45_9PSEU|nr:hypothetical protein [Amycolatopsis sp. 2-15]WIX79689.1 hypothetical protein QRX50_02470 [Amycolatopsis sp. 2-15]
MSVHAFVDESARNRQFLLCMTLVEPKHLNQTRRALSGLLLRGARELHFKKEKDPRRRQLIDQMAKLSISARIYTASCAPKTEEAARQRCLIQAVEDLLEMGAHRLVLDSRSHRDTHDRGTLQHALGERPSKTALTYEHLDSNLEPLLWVSDAVAWCFGAGGTWAQRASGLIAEHIKV